MHNLVDVLCHWRILQLVFLYVEFTVQVLDLEDTGNLGVAVNHDDVVLMVIEHVEDLVLQNFDLVVIA